MPELKQHYPSAIADNGLPGAPERAVRWTWERLGKSGGQMLVCIPRVNALRDTSVLREAASSPRAVTVTWRGPGSGGALDWSGGPVLAAWLTRDSLADVTEHRGVTALCVLSWSDVDTRGWRRGARPLLLGDRLHGSTAEQMREDETLVADPVVEAGLQSLSAMVNLGNALTTGMDHDDALAVLQVLHSGGHAVVDEDVYAWALAHGWGGSGAARLAELAAGVTAGRRLRRRIPRRQSLRAGVLDLWRAEAKPLT